ncbi:MAG TPA: cation:proton antiporter family protein [Candidatus Nanoarchaeia archaeon]|nr:cation:proton antiporter family protein [Candidatus Nanoarchaeia archaeon]
MTEEIFIQLTLLILIALALSFIARVLKQPLIIAYILTGLLSGPIFFNILKNTETIQIFSQFGIAFLLFIVGIHLNPRVIKEVGKISLITGIGQVLFTSIVGYFIGILLGLSPMYALYVAVALTFSSTIIIMKLLSDKEDLDKLYGKISVGFLIVQDLIAVLILMVVSSFSNNSNALMDIGKTLGLGFIITVALTLLSLFILPRLDKIFSKSQEFLFIFAIGWGLGIAALFFYMGMSLEIGALIAGVLLSVSPYYQEVSSKLKPLRDFFIIPFFIILGSQIVFQDISMFIWPIIIFSLFILVGNPLIVMVLMGIFGYSRKTGFMAGLTVAQISEFSMILVALGVSLGHLPLNILSLVTTIGMITIAGSTYMILYNEKLYSLIEKPLRIFERKKIIERDTKIDQNYEYFLLGYNRIGFSILQAFDKINKKGIVIDFNPEIIKKLSKRKIPCVYGDIDDLELLDQLKVHRAKFVLSTVPETDTNLLLIKKIRSVNKECVIIVTSRQITDAFKLYNAGADYVILPHFLGGEYTARLIEKYGANRDMYEKERKQNIKDLKEREKEGQKHPIVERD